MGTEKHNQVFLEYFKSILEGDGRIGKEPKKGLWKHKNSDPVVVP